MYIYIYIYLYIWNVPKGRDEKRNRQGHDNAGHVLYGHYTIISIHYNFELKVQFVDIIAKLFVSVQKYEVKVK